MNKKMEIKCKVHEVGTTQQISETFKKADLVVEYAENPSYPEYVRFEALQDKVALLDELIVGDEIELFFNLRGRPWTDKAGKTSYYNSLVIWKLNVLKTVADGGAQQPAYSAPAPVDTVQGEDDGLPF